MTANKAMTVGLFFGALAGGLLGVIAGTLLDGRLGRLGEGKAPDREARTPEAKVEGGDKIDGPPDRKAVDALTVIDEWLGNNARWEVPYEGRSIEARGTVLDVFPDGQVIIALIGREGGEGPGEVRAELPRGVAAGLRRKDRVVLVGRFDGAPTAQRGQGATLYLKEARLVK